MSGYTPLFDTLTEGTLCGRWPDIGLWPVLLSMADWRGHIDKTPLYISMVTGLSQAEVEACIDRFRAPDPDSRSRAHGGARLALIDTERSWGWKVVNIQLYRDRASGQNQVSDGRNAEKVRRYKERSKNTGRHRATPANTYSDSNTDLNKDKEEERARAREPPPAGLNAEAWNRWDAYRTAIRKPIKPASMQAAQRKLTGFGADQAAVVEQSIAQGWTGLFELKAENGNGHATPARKTRYEQMQETLRDATET